MVMDKTTLSGKATPLGEGEAAETTWGGPLIDVGGGAWYHKAARWRPVRLPEPGGTDDEKLNQRSGGNHLKKWMILFALALCAALVGCGRSAPSQEGGPSASQEAPGALSAPPAQEPSDTATASQPDASADPAPSEGQQTATLYIGTKAGGFAEYPMSYEGELTPELLIQGIADRTGWDLTLAEPVVSGKGGMSVCLSGESALFAGPPEPQKDEFHMYSAEQLAETILDSIQKTLQEGFTLEGGNPDALDIWYYMEGTQPLELPNLGLSWPIDQPYQWASAAVG